MRCSARFAVTTALLILSSAALLIADHNSEPAQVAEIERMPPQALEASASTDEPVWSMTPSSSALDIPADGMYRATERIGGPVAGDRRQPVSITGSSTAANRVPSINFTPAATAKFAPISLRVPVIGVDAPVIRVGVGDDGRMAAPDGYEELGWYERGPVPGESGHAVIAGHVDSLWGPAVFYDLDRLQPGDLIYVMASDGSERVFKVRDTQLYWEREAPIHDVFSVDGPAELVLITCGGEFDRDSATYLQRRVVFAELAT